MSHTIIWEPEGYYRKFEGEVSGEEILDSNFELQADPRFQSIKYVINDFTQIESHTIEIAHTNAYATTDEIVSLTKGALKIAIVVVNDDLLALAENYRQQMLGNRFDCEIFQSLDDARKWVGGT